MIENTNDNGIVSTTNLNGKSISLIIDSCLMRGLPSFSIEL